MTQIRSVPAADRGKAVLAAVLAALLLSASAATADELADRLCPILERVAAEGAGGASIMVQASLVMEVADAYDFKPEPLQDVLANADASTTAQCPETRTAILKLVEKDTLTEAMR